MSLLYRGKQLNNETAEEHLDLCRRAAKIAATGKVVDLDDISQELFTWILLKSKTITSPSYPGLLRLLVTTARGIILNDSFSRQPTGWSGLPWSTEEIRSHLRNDYSNLPPQFIEAMESDRMPPQYVTAIHSAYGPNGQKPVRGSATERTLYRAVNRLQEVINYPHSQNPPVVFDITELTNEEDARFSMCSEQDSIERRRDNEHRGRLADIATAVRR